MAIPDAPMPEDIVQTSPSAGLSEVATPDAFGANVGESAMRAGEVQVRLWHDANAAQVTRAHNDLDASSQDLLYNRKSGLLNQNLGENATPAVDTAASEYAAKSSEIRGRLTNDAQRRMFDATSSEHSQAFHRTLSEYEHHQVTQGQNAQTQAFIANRQTDIAQHYANPGLVAQNVAQTRYALVQAYARNTSGDPVALQKRVDDGNAPEALTHLLSASTSDAHMTAINAMLADGQNRMGSEYFEAHKEELDAKDLDTARRMVRAGNDNDKARETADVIIAKLHADATDETGNEDKSKESREAALNQLESMGIKDTQIYDNAQARIERHFRLMGEAHSDQQKALTQTAFDAMNTDGNTNFDYPANLRGQMDRSTASAMDSYQEQLRRRGRTQTIPETRLTLRSMAANPESWDAFASLDMLTYAHELDKVDFKHAQDDQAYVKGQIERRDTKLSQGMVSTKVTSELFAENGLELPKAPKAGEAPSQAYKDAAVRQDRFLSQLHHSVAAESLKLKRELTPDEVKEKAKSLFATQTWPQEPGWFGRTFDYTGVGSGTTLFGLDKKTGPAFDAPFADKIAYRVEDIPAENLRIMQKHDAASGATRSRDQLIKDYNETLARGYALSLVTK